MSTAAELLSVLLLGTVNWLSTIIVVDNKIFEDVREVVEKFGEKVETHTPRIGNKIRYFTGCYMCVGTWVGIVEAAVVGGPFHLRGAIFGTIATVILNGLAYKAIGHLVLQLSAGMHNLVELLKAKAELETKKLAPIPADNNGPDRELAMLVENKTPVVGANAR